MRIKHLLLRNKLTFATICLSIVVLILVGVAATLHVQRSLDAGSKTTPTKTFGVVGNPDSLVTWSKKTGLKPTMPMEFEAWSKNRTLDDHFADAKRDGYKNYMITWEPWQPVPAKLGLNAQSSIQPAYSNAAIAAGSQDEYITRFAKSVARSGLDTVYIRYAHEMNGTWYPWSTDSDAYIKAWQHVVTIFRNNGATNAKFVFATNPSPYQTDDAWTARFKQYYPGDEYVDYVGSTMINFGSTPCQTIPCTGGEKGYSVALFKQRIRMNYALTGKEIIISEMNTALQEDTAVWLSDLSAYVADKDSHIHGVVLSQAPSRGAAQMETGDLSWNISDQPALYAALRKLMATATK